MGGQSTQVEKARAKINLTLHVGPKRPDGYHPLHSLVVFADIGDVLELRTMGSPKKPTLSIDGPFSQSLADTEDNLILRAAEIVLGEGRDGADFHLTKNLPIASGIGGGSADAAAAARLLCRTHRIDPQVYEPGLLDLGADIPVCLASQTCVMTGRGENIMPLPDMGVLNAVLVNPGVEVSTRRVFDKFDEMLTGDQWNAEVLRSDDRGLLKTAKAGRNDLQTAAISCVPEIASVLEIMATQQHCQLARMTGSGATCFAIFPDEISAAKAAASVQGLKPNWWCVATVLGDAA